jgi:hypothetical protein
VGVISVVSNISQLASDCERDKSTPLGGTLQVLKETRVTLARVEVKEAWVFFFCFFFFFLGREGEKRHNIHF